MFEILIELAKIVPVIAVLWLIIVWFKKNYKSKEEYYCTYGVCVPKGDDGGV